MTGYECDICGDFYPGEPYYTMQPKDGAQYLMRGSEWVAGAREYDICPACWGEKIQPAIWAILGDREESDDLD